MKLPELQASRRTSQMTTSFQGYNHTEIIDDGEMFDMKNMSGDMYPTMTQRAKRGKTYFDIAGCTDKLSGIHGRDQLVFTLGKDVYYAFLKVPGISVSDDEAMLPKKIVSMGAYVCIWPDKVYFNTADLSDAGYMDRIWEADGEDISMSLCRGNGEDYGPLNIGTEPPAEPDNGTLWIDQTGTSDVLKQWDATTDEWVEVATTFVRIASPGITEGLKQYDAVEISGLAPDPEADARTVEQVAALNGSYLVQFYKKTDLEEYIVVAGLLSRSQAQMAAGEVTINREVPDLDFICESGNRLWGCKYGLVNGETVNCIRASALGDFKNWNRYMGNSQDSYTMNIGTDGPFTGAITQRGYPVFFKENFIHRISGQTPSTFSNNTTVCRGVQLGSWRSVQVVNEAIYYKSRQDVMVYDGNMPVSISEKLGNVLYSDARAGAIGGKYYISMKDQAGRWSQFVYDTEKSLWFKEDDVTAMGYGAVGDELFYIDESDNTLVAAMGSYGELEDDLEWFATFGLCGLEYRSNYKGRMVRDDTQEKRYLSRFNLRVYIEPGCWLKMEIEYDSSGTWEEMGVIRGESMKTYTIPVVPRRCEHLRVRLSGEGECRIYAITKQMEVGSDA